MQSNTPSNPPDDNGGIVADAAAPTSEVITPTLVPEKKRDTPTHIKLADRRKRAKNTAMRKLKVHHRKFVLTTLETNDPKKGVKAAGLVPSNSPMAIQQRAQALLSSPRIQNALEEKLNELYPDLRDKVSEKINSILSLQVVSGKVPPGGLPPGFITVDEFLKTADTLIRVHGWEAAKKSAHIRANITPGSMLPGMKK